MLMVGPGPLRRCAKEGAVDHLHRRNRRHRPTKRWVLRDERRERADAQPTAGRNGRI
jgi:hypothetical protein